MKNFGFPQFSGIYEVHNHHYLTAYIYIYIYI